jgi:hypothetical protein
VKEAKAAGWRRRRLRESLALTIGSVPRVEGRLLRRPLAVLAWLRYGEFGVRGCLTSLAERSSRSTSQIVALARRKTTPSSLAWLTRVPTAWLAAAE